MTVIYKFFICFFMFRVASDLSEYRNVGMQLASAVLQSQMKTINFTIAPSSNANQIKSELFDCLSKTISS